MSPWHITSARAMPAHVTMLCGGCISGPRITRARGGVHYRQLDQLLAQASRPGADPASVNRAGLLAYYTWRDMHNVWARSILLRVREVAFIVAFVQAQLYRALLHHE